MPVREFFVLLMVCTLWGLHFTVMRITVGELGNPLFYAALRMSCVGLILLPFLKWHSGKMRYILLAGLCFGALNFALIFPAMGMTTAGAGSIAIELYVPFSIILAIIFLGERVGLPRLVGIALAFAGVAIISLGKPPEEAGRLFILGIVMIGAAGFCEAVGAIFIKSIKTVGPFQLLAWFGVVGTLVLWPLTFTLEQNQFHVFGPDTRAQFLLALGYSVIGASIIAHAAYYWLLGRLPMYQIAGTGLINPVVGVTAGVIILKEPISAPIIIGGAMTAIGVYLILARARKPKGQVAPGET